MSSQEPPGALKQPLKSFVDETHLSKIRLDGQARWHAGNLELHYYLQYSDGDLILPSASSTERRDGLWEHTCFEAFVGQPGQLGYWEINLSPNGDWNFYHLSGYRENLKPDDALNKLPITLHKNASGLELSCTVPLSSVIDPDSPLEISLTAVLEHPTEGCSFWAWKHSGKEADFHLRESFTALAPSKQS